MPRRKKVENLSLEEMLMKTEQEIKTTEANDLRDFMNLACKCRSDVGVHTDYNQIADAKSILGLMALDYDQPVKVVTEDEDFLKKLDKWAVDM